MKNLILILLLTVSSFIYSQAQDSYMFNRRVTNTEDVREDYFFTTPNDIEGNYTIRIADTLDNTIFQYQVVDYYNTPEGGLMFNLLDSYGNQYKLKLSPSFDEIRLINTLTKEWIIFIREQSHINRI